MSCAGCVNSKLESPHGHGLCCDTKCDVSAPPLAAGVGQPAGGLRQPGGREGLGVGEGCFHSNVAFTGRNGDQDPPAASDV